METNPTKNQRGWESMQAYLLAASCLLLGIAVGYFVRGSAAQVPATSANAAAAAAPGAPAGTQAQVTPAQLKRMADKQAEPLLAQLRSNPNDPGLLAQIGNVYYDAQSYKEAIQFYEQSLKADPTNANVRTDCGTAYYYLGDSDRALQEFQTALQYDPKHVQTMFNTGMVQWKGKGDVKTAVATWEHLLKIAPADFAGRGQVQELIEKAKEHVTMAPGTKTDKPAGF
jgi:cytochrome c-type biogenesis protein CcmH/NrfG